ncbi:MAG: RNase adapter RapZ [Lachnospiraceae bacterium]|nr:RNase adapter RapZ [Lachnospiraceae bacterium]
MRIVIVTGMSGAGKSSALKMLEDAGYFCVDNMPVPLLHNFIRLSADKTVENYKVAVGVDIRSGNSLKNLGKILDEVEEEEYDYEILYLDCSSKVLVKRYKETRRNHPLARKGRVDEAIQIERDMLEFLKDRADYIIDTSTLLIRELKAQIDNIFVNEGEFKNFYITVVSFGFKYGLVSDADLVFDVRFLSNPFYIPELKPLTGNDEEVYNYVMGSDGAKEFLDKLTDMIKFLIPKYIEEGKNQLIVGVGCTGGKHRSVTLANALYNELKDLDYGLKVEHRDIQKDSIRKNTKI